MRILPQPGKVFTERLFCNITVTGDIVPLYNPRLHGWEAHFAWSSDYSLIEGLTPIGRATIVKLQLNRNGVVNLRIALSSIGNHP